MTSRRDYQALHQRRNELARQRGFRSYAEQRRAPRRITGPDVLGQLPEAAQRQRKAALDVIAVMRREGLDLTAAARTCPHPSRVVLRARSV